MTHRSLVAVAAATLAMMALCGCLGYRHGALAHPQLKSVAVVAVDNRTDQPRSATWLRHHLGEQFHLDGALRVVGEEEADSVLRAAVIGYDVASMAEVRAVSRDEEQRLYRPTSYRITVDVEFELLRGDGKGAILTRRAVQGSSEFTELTDLDVVRKDGLRQALRDAAAKVVAGITEAW